MTARISIALATYNGEKYIAEQLQSFCTQTKLPDELIVCDDCSQDKTLTILCNFAKNAPFFVKVIENQKNLGWAQNFSKAISLCTGDIIFISDQDDVWLTSKIEKIIYYFSSNPEVQLLIHDIEYCKDDLTPIGQTKIERMEEIFDIQHDFVVGMATAIQRPFLQYCLPVPKETNIGHDKWLHQCATAIGKKKVVKDVLALYRRHNSNVMSDNRFNVGQVTTSAYLKRTPLEKIQRILNKKEELNNLLRDPLIPWLLNNRNILINKNYTTEKEIDYFIKKKLTLIEDIEERYNILVLSRWKRLISIYKFYIKGGYVNYDGWMSAISDIFSFK